jgi:hypothetical protein
LVEHWTLLDGDRELVAGKRGASRLAFALMLKFYARHGRFPDDHADLPGDVVEFVARQVQVAPEAVRGYEFLRPDDRVPPRPDPPAFGFRECTVEDARGFKAGSPSQEILHQPAWTDRLTIEDRRGGSFLYRA